MYAQYPMLQLVVVLYTFVVLGEWVICEVTPSDSFSRQTLPLANSYICLSYTCVQPGDTLTEILIKFCIANHSFQKFTEPFGFQRVSRIKPLDIIVLVAFKPRHEDVCLHRVV